MNGFDPIPEENMAWDNYYKLYYEDDDDENDPENNYTYTTLPNMAEGGYDPTDPTNEKTPLIPNTGDDDDDNTEPWDDTSKWQYGEDGVLERIPTHDTDSTQPFEPGAASTPAGGGEQIPMATRTRLPQERGPRIAETSSGGKPTERMAWSEIKGEFEMADKSKLKVRYKVAPRARGEGGGAILEVAMKGKDKWYRLYTKSPGDVEKSFNESLPKEIKTALGKSRGKRGLEGARRTLE